jgi:REP element-mobilizing transposase RayT
MKVVCACIALAVGLVYILTVASGNATDSTLGGPGNPNTHWRRKRNLVPTLCVGMPSSTLRVAGKALVSKLKLSAAENLRSEASRRGEPSTMSRSRYHFGENPVPHFLTCTIVGWLPVFTRPETVQIVFDSWKFLQDKQRMTIFGYVILENHLHLIASANDLSKEVGDFKSFTARMIVDYLVEQGARTILNQLTYHKAPHKTDRDFQLWQEGSHPEEIANEDVMRQKLDYVHYNPVKRGYIDDPTHWRYSSARVYAGQAGLLPVCRDW